MYKALIVKYILEFQVMSNNYLLQKLIMLHWPGAKILPETLVILNPLIATFFTANFYKTLLTILDLITCNSITDFGT